MASSPLTINCHDQGRTLLSTTKVLNDGASASAESTDMECKMYGESSMYVTLNSAAQHSPDTTWTLPSEQADAEVPGLDTEKEVAEVMQEHPMPLEPVPESQHDDKAKDKEVHSTTGSSEVSHTDPWQLEVQGLPWQTRHPLLMRNLTESWKREKMCPHPNCPQRHSTPMTYPTANPLIYHHWYTMHMAPGYCKIFTCELCSKVLKTKPAMKSHLVASHKFGDSEAATLVRKMEGQWENLVDGKRDPAPGYPWKHCDSVSIQHLLTTWKANKFTCPHHACKSRLYRPWQAVLHWYQDHMAIGFSQSYACPSCGKQFILLEFFRHHLEIDHGLMQEVTHGIVESTLTLWSKLVELKKPLTDVVIAANRKERMSNVKLPPQKLVEAAGMPWRMWCLETSRAVVAAWLIDEKVRCPHPGCSDKIKSEEEVMLHWQDQHMAPEFGTMYPCQHGVGSQYPCTKVFINKHDIIVHSKTEHGYSDWVIDAMLRNIEAATTARQEMGESKEMHSQVDVLYAQINGDTQSTELHKDTANSNLNDKVENCNFQHKPQSIYICQHGLGSQYPCNKAFESEESLVTHAKSAHLYDDFVINAMLRNIKVNKKEQASPSKVPLAASHINNNDNVDVFHHQNVMTKTSEPLVQEQEFIAERMVTSDIAKQDLQAILWKAIVAAWTNDKRCPHPKCIVSSDNHFPEYGQMLGHWMRNHIDYNLMERTFYPCLHGQNAQDLCMTVYSSASDLKHHSVSVHKYRSEEIDLFISTLEAHIDNLTQEFCGPALVSEQLVPAVGSAGTAVQQDKEVEDKVRGDSDQPAHKVARLNHSPNM